MKQLIQLIEEFTIWDQALAEHDADNLERTRIDVTRRMPFLLIEQIKRGHSYVLIIVVVSLER